MVNAFLEILNKMLGHKVRTTRFCTARIANNAANNNFVRKNVTHDDHDNNNDAKPVNAARFKTAKVELSQVTGIFRRFFQFR